MANKKDNNLLEPDSAVENYFDDLLSEAKETVTQAQARPVSLKVTELVMPDLEEELARIEEVEEVKPEIISPLVEPEIEESISTAETQPDIDTEVEQEKPNVDEPVDYDFPLQCLNFRVGNQNLSIPLIDMGSVQNWEQNMTRIPGTPDWFLGLFQYRDSNVRVVDSAVFLSIPTTDNDPDSRHIMVLKDEAWAITCDVLGEVVYLQQDDIKWSNSSHSGYSLGVVKDSLAMLLDPLRLLNALREYQQLPTNSAD